MKKKYLILAITAFTFIAGISNTVQAQTADTTLSFGKYLVKSPWVTTYAINFNDNDGILNPFEFKPFQNPTPFKFAFEKNIFGFRNWKHTEGFTAQLALASSSLGYRDYTTMDLNLKYDLLKSKNKVDLYLLLGGGYTYYSPTNVSQGIDEIGKYMKDNFLNINFGGGLNWWVFDNVGINLQSTAKFAILLGGGNYIEHSAGLVFRIGGKVAEVEKPYTYERSKEAEDALIHLREHINQ